VAFAPKNTPAKINPMIGNDLPAGGHPIEQGVLHVAAAFADITPSLPFPTGCFVRGEPFSAIASRLEANAVAFHNGSGRSCVLISLDALYVGAELQSTLSDHFERRGQRRDDLLVVASHTHFAPSLDSTKQMLALVDGDYFERTAESCRDLIDRVLSGPRRKAKVERKAGHSNAAVNRRRWWYLPHIVRRRIARPQIVMAPNVKGEIDRRITTWTVMGDDGRPVTLLWHYTCHPTGYPSPDHISAEYPGVVRSRLRARYGDLPVLFFQGFAGDARPHVPETRPRLRRAVWTALTGPSFDKFTTRGWEQWAEMLANDVLIAFSDGTPVENSGDSLPTLGAASVEIPLDLLLNAPPSARTIRFQRLRPHPSLDLVAVSAEPLASLAGRVTSLGSTAVGYLGDVFGYWPSDREAARGGYEVNHFRHGFSLQGGFKPGLDKAFGDALEKLRQPQ
jgi:hypothetical protein